MGALANLFTGTVGKWALRRVMELGGLATLLATVDPTVLQNLLRALGSIVTGDFENVSLGTIIALVGMIWGLVWNGASTFSPHVTVEGERIDVKELPAPKRRRVREQVEPIVEKRKRKSIFERLRSR